ncbi:MAG TPA: hypothetical protein VFC78_25130 [Tepidisphaeraceae bacterium]|nr:hypothetical protein [Tepidisphaeraceae bacterium]
MQESHLIPWVMARPFEPFAAFVSDGRRIEVTHPESAMLAEFALALYVFFPGGQVELIDAFHITSIRTISATDPNHYFR